MSEAKNRRDKKSRAFIQPGQIFYQLQKRMENTHAGVFQDWIKNFTTQTKS